MRTLTNLLITATLINIPTVPSLAQELIISDRIVEPGIHFIFEGIIAEYAGVDFGEIANTSRR